MSLYNYSTLEIGKVTSLEAEPTTWDRLKYIGELPDLGDDPEIIEKAFVDMGNHTELGEATFAALEIEMGLAINGDTTFDKLLALAGTIKPTELHKVRFVLSSGYTVSTVVNGLNLKIMGGAFNDIQMYGASFTRSSKFKIEKKVVETRTVKKESKVTDKTE